MRSETERKYFLKIQKLMEEKIGLLPNSLSLQNWESSLESRMNTCHKDDFRQYYTYLLESLTEIQELTDLIVIPETWFFREERCFQFLTEYIKQFGEDYRKGTPLKILSLGCSTGEEPYSIVICLLEAGMPLGSFRIEAVDVSKQSLNYAQRGLYGPNSFRGLRLKIKNKYFKKAGNRYQIDDRVRFTVKFKKANVVNFPKNFVRETYDIIFCRNLLIYLSPALQENLLKRLEGALVSKGILVLGEMEYGKINHLNFETLILARHTAYCKTPKKTLPEMVDKLKLEPPKHEEKSREYTLEMIREKADRGDLIRAEEMIKDYEKKNRDCPEIQFLKGLVAHANGKKKEAYDYFLKTIFLDPWHHEALTYLSLMSEGEVSQHYKERAERLKKEP